MPIVLLGNSMFPDSPGEWLFIIILIFGASMIASYLLPNRAGDDDLPRFLRGYYSLGWLINWACLLLVFAAAVAYIALGHGVGRLIGLAIALSVAAYSVVTFRKWQRRRRTNVHSREPPLG
jgi:hypothetical protein